MTLGSKMNEPADLTLPPISGNPLGGGGNHERTPDF
jgi:hypothetical protein